MSKLNVGVIGCGYWGINYVRVFSELLGAPAVLACDRRADRLSEVARRSPGVMLTDDPAALLRRDELDAVVLCTEATAHYAVARECLLAGKHLLIEKPITTRASEAEELVSLAEAAGRILMVGHTFLYNPGIAKIKSYMDGNELGRVYYTYARRTNLGPIRHDVNALWDLAPHDVAIFNYLLGQTPAWVSAVGSRVLDNGREDVGFISLGYADGVIGHIHVSWADPNKVREVVVVGSDKRIVFDDLNSMERVRVFEKGVTRAPAEASSYGEHQYLLRDGNIISPRVDASEPLKNQCSHFLNCVTTGQSPRSDGRAGLQVVRVMEAVDQSVARQGAPVSLE
jgi:predicted dehydrogenase